MRYPVLLFDLYGTLVDVSTREDVRSVWGKLALFYGYRGAHYTPGELRSAFFAEMEARNAAARRTGIAFPDPPVEPVLAALFQRKGVQRDLPSAAREAAQTMRMLQTRHIRLYPGVRRALAALRGAGHTLAILSNAQAGFTMPELRLLQIDRCVDAIYLSSDFCCRKPDPRFFRVPIRALGVQANECLMIGNDAATDVAGAKGVGMGALYLHTNLSPAANPRDLALADDTWQGADWRTLLPRLLEIAR